MLEGFENREAFAICVAAVFDGQEMLSGKGGEKREKLRAVCEVKMVLGGMLYLSLNTTKKLMLK